MYLECRVPFDEIDLEDCRVEYLPKTKKRSERRGEEGVLSALEYQFSIKSFSRGDVLISDNEKAFDTDLVRGLLEQKVCFDILSKISNLKLTCRE